jgi:antitoxin CcdA
MRKVYAHIIDASLYTRTDAMPAAEATNSTRKPTNLSLDSELLKEAKALGINVSRSAEAGIAEAVKRHKQEQWLKENASALASSNAYVEANGLPLARHRQF